MTINYTTLLGLAKPVTGTESGAWGDVVNDQITSLVEDAIANSASINVTSGNVTLTDNNGTADQARMAILLVSGTPGTTRNIVAPSTSKWYIVRNGSNDAVVIKGSATTGVTIPTGSDALVFWNGSDFEVGGMAGPTSSTDNAVVRYDGTTGKVVQNSSVFIDDSGNLGVGTSSPGTTLQVAGQAWFSASSTEPRSLEIGINRSGDGNSFIDFVGDTTYSNYGLRVLRNGGANGVSEIDHRGTGILALKAIDAGTVAFYTSNLERMRIDSSGNVGIGTSSPLQRFNAVNSSITGGGPASSGSAADPNAVSRFQAGSIVMDFGVYSAGSMWIQNRVVSNYALYTDLILQPNGGNVGIGTSSPGSYGRLASVGATAYAASLVAVSNSSGASWARIDLKHQALANTAILYLDQAGEFAIRNDYNGPIVFYTNGGNERMRITAAGELLIGTTTDNGAYLLQVNSQIWATNATIATSDARLKKNVAPISGALATVKALHPVAFDFKQDTEYNFDAERQTGFIAQDLQTALDGQDYADCVVKECGPYLGVAYEKLIPVLTKAIQEQQVIIEQLTQRIAALEGA